MSINLLRASMRNATFCARLNGLSWYGKVWQECERIGAASGLSPFKVAGIISHLSPMRTYSENMIKAEEFCLTGDTRAFGAQLRGCREILALSTDDIDAIASTFGKGAHKTRSFFRNIAGDENAVTIDRWAVRAAGGDWDKWNSASAKGYEALAGDYRQVASEFGVTPAQCQAITWCAIRGSAF